MSFEQVDIEQIKCNIEEISNVQKDTICSSCKQSLTPVAGKDYLLKCSKCSKFTLSKNNNTQTSITLQIGMIKKIL